jgi:hypothetical protein
VLVKCESAHAAHRLLSKLVGDCLPDSNSPWRVCIDSAHVSDGRTFTTEFQEIVPHETRKTLLRSTSAIFIPNDLGQSVAEIGEDYSAGSSPY